MRCLSCGVLALSSALDNGNSSKFVLAWIKIFRGQAFFCCIAVSIRSVISGSQIAHSGSGNRS